MVINRMQRTEKEFKEFIKSFSKSKGFIKFMISDILNEQFQEVQK